jgi:hypothetical protein
MTTNFYVTVTACCPVSNNCFISINLPVPGVFRPHVIVVLPLADLHNPNAAPKTVVMGKLSLLPYPTAPFASKLTPDASSCATD